VRVRVSCLFVLVRVCVCVCVFARVLLDCVHRGSAGAHHSSDLVV